MGSMTGQRMKDKMTEYQNALEEMSSEAVEYVRGIPVVKTFGQSVFSFKKFIAIEGKKLDSVAFSQQMDRLMVSGTSTIDFVIGGSLGLYKDVLSRADFLLSFSDMTFPHQLMRVILLEQVYRAFRISNKEPYHK